MTREEKIRTLNDALRTTFLGGRVMVTSGIRALALETNAKVLAAVRAFTAFTEDNNPHGEHDFGVIEVDGVKVFFKIDCYDRRGEAASPDPADPAVTSRVLTIMLADEY